MLGWSYTIEFHLLSYKIQFLKNLHDVFIDEVINFQIFNLTILPDSLVKFTI